MAKRKAKNAVEPAMSNDMKDYRAHDDMHTLCRAEEKSLFPEKFENLKYFSVIFQKSSKIHKKISDF